MVYLTVEQVLRIHDESLRRYGGLAGVRDAGALDGAVAQPRMTFGGAELYPTLVAKVAALGYALLRGHPFNDGNKRAGFGAIDLTLRLNGRRLTAGIDDLEALVLGVAAGSVGRADLAAWLGGRLA